MRFSRKLRHEPIALRFLMFSIAAVVFAATGHGETPPSTADAIYFGGIIITIADAQPSAEAVAIKDGKILAVGNKADIEKAYKDKETNMIDLGGKTLLPGFVDAHSHLSQVGLLPASANLLPYPDGEGNSIPAIKKLMGEQITKEGSRLGTKNVVVGANYDDSQLDEKRHPTRWELDAICEDIKESKDCKEIPIVVVHQSTHMGVFNSKALELLGITKGKGFDPKPKSGEIHLMEEDGELNGEPNGLIDEDAFATAIGKLLIFDPETTIDLLVKAQVEYKKYGFTTVQEGRADPVTLERMIHAQPPTFELDVVAYPDLDLLEGAKKESLIPSPLPRTYKDHFRIGGVKLGLDGSPQGKTAWFTKPYLIPPSGTAANYKGSGAYEYDYEKLSKLVQRAYDNHWQLMAHANGDAAIDQLIKAVRAVNEPGIDRRTVLIHGQYLRADQIPQLKQLGIFPSLFPMHTYYWGDWHRDSVAGPERADFISPTGAVLAAGMKFSIHSDAPVTFPNSMRILDSAVNRTTRTADILGPTQRLEPIDALKAMTLWPAYQHFEESTKGSIEVGKLADFVILCQNPLTVDRKKLVDIQVQETIKDGKSIYKNKKLPCPEP